MIKIRNINDVRQFLDARIRELGFGFHPDTDFRHYIVLGTGQPTFDTEDAEYLNDGLSQCIDWCLVNNCDIYNLAMNSDAWLELREQYENAFQAKTKPVS